MSFLDTYGLSAVIFLPALAGVALMFVPSRDAARKVALVASIVTFVFASYLGYQYGWNADKHDNVDTAFAAKQSEILKDLAPADRLSAEAAIASPSPEKLRAMADGPAKSAAREILELNAARRVLSSKHLRFVEHYTWIPSFNIHYFVAVDGLSLPLVWLTTLLTVLCLVYTFSIQDGEGTKYRRPKAYYALFLLLETGLLGVFCALDFFLFYVFWEIVLLPMYFLIGVWGGPRRIYASIKFFIYTLFGSVLMLIAILAMYFVIEPHAGFASFNVLTLTDIVPTLTQITAFGQPLAGFDFRWWLFMAMFIGFAIKVPVFPFHTWLPDAHVEAPTSGSMILAGIMLKMGGYGFFRMLYPLAPDVATSTGIIYFIAILGLINVVYGALVAMAQSDFKALVAYSSISHMGYVLLGLAAVNATGFMGGVLQMFNHGVSSAMLFCLVGVVYERAHHRRLNDFGGMALQMPRYFGLAVIGFFASLGLPGLNGFISEALTFLGIYQPDSLIADGWAATGVGAGINARWIVYVSLTGILFTAGYILWTVQRVFFGECPEKYQTFPDLKASEAIALVPLAALCIILGVYPSVIIDYMEPSLNAIIETVRAAAVAAG